MCLALVLLAPGLAWSGGATTAPGPSLVGIDHVPVVVENIEEAEASYRRLGFSLKPGRPHANGLRNSHIKFKDGSGIELVSPPRQPGDALARTYAGLLNQGEGPVFLSFHARDMQALRVALGRANLGFEETDGLLTLLDPRLDFIFFLRDNRSPTDLPEHLAHANSAIAMAEVWLALDGPGRDSLRHLMRAVGSVESHESVGAPGKTNADVFTVQNGRVVVVPETCQRQGRRIFGAQFVVREPWRANQFLGVTRSRTASNAVHGLWLRFEDKR